MRKNGIVKNCLVCKKGYYIAQWRINRGNSKYCSASCRGSQVRTWSGNIGFKKGMIPWNKNKKLHYSVWNKGKKGIFKHTEAWKIKMSKKIKKLGNKPPIMIGINHPNWKGGITPRNKKERNRFRELMQSLVFKRDNYTCQLCFKKGGYLQVDHIQSWKDYVELRFSMDNCRTLCMDCHYLITWGKLKPKEIKTWGHNMKYRKGVFKNNV